MGLVRGVPDGEFHAMVSVLRDRAEKAATGFLSVEVWWCGRKAIGYCLPLINACWGF